MWISEKVRKIIAQRRAINGLVKKNLKERCSDAGLGI